MATEFFDVWNATLPAFEAMFTEDWIYNGNTYPAISIDRGVKLTKVMKGGEFQDVSVTIYVRSDVFASSGVVQDATITARGQDFAILELQYEGDECVIMVCGPAQVDVWGK